MKTLTTLALVAFTTVAAAPAFAEGDIAKGEKAFKKCKACHMIKNGDDIIFKGGKTGPNLYGIVGRAVAGEESYSKYGKGLTALGETGMVWDEATLVAWITNPKGFLKDHEAPAKTGMSFKLKKGGEDVVAFLASVGPQPVDDAEAPSE